MELIVDYNKSLLDLGAWDAEYVDCGIARTPLKDLDVLEILRMLGQGVGEEFLIPLVLERLPLGLNSSQIHYDYLDLFICILKTSGEFWDQNPKIKGQVEKVYKQLFPVLSDVDEDLIKKIINRDLLPAYQIFTEIAPVEGLLLNKISLRSQPDQVVPSNTLRLLAIIVNKGPIALDDLNAIIMYFYPSGDFNRAFDYLVGEKMIQIQYEGPTPSPLVVRLKKDFKEKLLKIKNNS